jgi:ABC-type multidrug transport system fused ATPase/permease subunit
VRSVLIQLWNLLEPRQKRRLVLLQFVSIFMAFSTVFGIAAVMPFFAVLGDPGIVERNEWLGWIWELLGRPEYGRFVTLLGIGLVASIALSGTFNLLGALAMTRFCFWVGNDFQVLLFSEYLQRDYLFHARTNSARLVNNTVQQVGWVLSGILQTGIVLVTSLLQILAIVAAIVVVNPRIAIGAAVLLGGAYALIYLLVRKRLLFYGEITAEQQAKQLKTLNEGFGGIKEITLLGTGNMFRRSFEKGCWRISRTQANAQVISQSPRFLLETLSVAGLVVTSLVLAVNTENLGGTMAQLTFLALATYRLLPALQGVFKSIATMRLRRAAFKRVADDIRQGREREAMESASAAVAPWHDRPRRSIRFEGLTFHYEAGGRPVLDGVDLEIPAGSTVAFVGASGSGKTTAIDVLLGLLTPDDGRLVVDGEEIVAERRRAWQGCLAYVPQQIFLTDGTIGENIAFGIDRRRIDRDRVTRCAEMASLGPLLDELEAGLDTVIGERGVRLSGGQRQRIGIARALYRDAKVIVFDEATSALDGITEQEVMRSIDALHGERTVVLIAHRLTTVRNADIIFELEHGRIVRQGTYDELLATSDRFRKMAGLDETETSVASTTDSTS